MGTDAGIVNRVILRREMSGPDHGRPSRRSTTSGHFEQEPRRRDREGEAYGHKLSVLVLDIDNFKALSERHGLPVGNAVLSDFGKLLKKFARGTDCVARYSGEEFMILLPHTMPRMRATPRTYPDGRGGAFVPAPEAAHRERGDRRPSRRRQTTRSHSWSGPISRCYRARAAEAAAASAPAFDTETVIN